MTAQILSLAAFRLLRGAVAATTTRPESERPASDSADCLLAAAAAMRASFAELRMQTATLAERMASLRDRSDGIKTSSVGLAAYTSEKFEPIGELDLPNLGRGE